MQADTAADTAMSNQGQYPLTDTAKAETNVVEFSQHHAVSDKFLYSYFSYST